MSDRSKKILIVHASAGHGHKKAAEAIYENFKTFGNETEVQMWDALDFTPGFFGRNYRSVYLFLIRYLAWFWGFSYWALDQKYVYGLVRVFRRMNNAFFASRLAKQITQLKPDVIVCTHFMSIEVIHHLKKTGIIDSKFATVITDFWPHRFWIESTVDLYLVANAYTAEALKKRGVLAEKISVTGIPVGLPFAQVQMNTSLRESLGLKTQVFTLLLTGGGAGIGNATALIQKLCHQIPLIQILIVCGTNQNMHRQMLGEEKANTHLKTFGFVHNMHELMAVSDVIVGKGGGLTLSEALSLKKPMIVFQPVPGQESRNAEFIAHCNAGYYAHSVDDVVGYASQIAQWSQADKANFDRLVGPLSRADASNRILDDVKKLLA